MGAQLGSPEHEQLYSALEEVEEDEGNASSILDAELDASMGEETDASGCILDGLDSMCGVSMTFQSLNAALCGLQQKPMEPTRAYYNHMAQITDIFREHHGNHYRLGELVRMSQDCFYAGFLPENHPMVVHLKDQPHTTPLDLLKVLLEQEENDALTCTCYPPSTSARPSHPPKPMGRYHRQPPTDKRNDGYTVCPTPLDASQVEVAPETDPSMFGNSVDALESW